VIAKLWSQVFWKDASEDEIIVDSFQSLSTFRKVLLVLPICILAAVSVYIGLNAEVIIQVSSRISDELMEKTPYIQAVLGK